MALQLSHNLVLYFKPEIKARHMSLSEQDRIKLNNPDDDDDDDSYFCIPLFSVVVVIVTGLTFAVACVSSADVGDIDGMAT